MLAFALGVFLSCFAVIWAPGPDGVWFGTALLLAVALAWWLRSGLAFITGGMLGTLVAALAVAGALERQSVNWPASARLSGTIDGLVAHHDDHLRFDFLVEDGPVAPARIRVSWRDPAVRPLSGERWQLPLALETPAGTPLPGNFDQQRWQFRHGIQASGRVQGHETAQRLAPSAGGLHAFRTRLSQAIDSALDGSPSAALIRGVTVGDRSGFAGEQWTVLNATGTTHLVAISGLHIGLVAGLVFALLRLPARGWPGAVPASLLAGLGALLCATAYAALAGFALPTQRALSMFACLIGLLLLRRRTGVSAGLSLAAVLVLVLDPMAVMDPGFYLSFALVGLVMMVVAAGDRPGALSAFVRVQWVTGLAVLPMLLLFFAHGPLASPLANALAVPVFSFVVVPLALLGAGLLAAGWESVAGWPLALAEGALDRLWPWLEGLASGPAVTGSGGAGIGLLLMALLAMAALVLPGPRPARAVLVLALLPAVAGTQAALGPRLEGWALDGDGYLWRLSRGSERLLWVKADGRSLDYATRQWLRRQADDGRSRLVMDTGEGLGPGRLDGLAAAFGPGRVFFAEAGRASPGPARFCGAGAVGPLQLDRVNGRCRVHWPMAGGRLSLGQEALLFRGSEQEAHWCWPQTDWARWVAGRITAEGRLVVQPPRAFWWRPVQDRISVPEANTVSCSGI